MTLRLSNIIKARLMYDVVHKKVMIDQRKKPKDLKEKTGIVDEASDTLEKENPTDIGPGITEIRRGLNIGKGLFFLEHNTLRPGHEPLSRRARKPTHFRGGMKASSILAAAGNNRLLQLGKVSHPLVCS